MELSDKDAATSAESANIELSNSSNQMTVPVQVVVSNPTPKIQRRISTVLKTDIQEYLQGYGEDYGATSSTTNLIEGVHSYSLPVGDDSPSPSMALSPTSQPDVSIAEENEGLTSMQLSSSPLDHQTDMDKSIPKFKKGLRHRLFGEKSKKNNDGEHPSDVSALGIKSDATIQNELMTSGVTPLHAEGKQKLDDTSTIMKNEDIDQPPTEHPADDDSVKVNLSLQESSGSEQASLNEQIDESLPLERESVSELVQKLQLSLEAHTPSYVIQVCRLCFVFGHFTLCSIDLLATSEKEIFCFKFISWQRQTSSTMTRCLISMYKCCHFISFPLYIIVRYSFAFCSTQAKYGINLD